MKRLIGFIAVFALSAGAFGQSFQTMYPARYHYELDQKYDSLRVAYLRLDSLKSALLGDTVLLAQSITGGEVKKINKSSLHLSDGYIDQSGGVYGKFYNTNTGGALGGIGVTRMGGFAKPADNGFFLNGYFDISGVSGNPEDTCVFFCGYIDTTDFSGTRFELGNHHASLSTDSFFDLTTQLLQLNANEYVVENINEDVLEYVVGTGSDGKTLRQYPVSQFIEENVPAEFKQTDNVVCSVLSGGEQKWLIGDSTWGSNSFSVVTLDKYNHVFSAGNQNNYATANFGSILLGMYNSATESNATAIGSANSAAYLATAIGYNVHSPSMSMVSLGSSNDTTIFPSLTSDYWIPQEPIFTLGNGFGGLSNALVVLKNGNTAIGNIVPQERLHVNGRLRVDSLPSATESDSIVTVDSLGVFKKRTVSSLGCGGCECVIKDTVIYITDTLAIQNCFTTPIELLNIPGLNLIRIFAKYSYQSNPYNFVGATYLRKNDFNIANLSLTGSATMYRTLESVPFEENLSSPLYLMSLTDDATQGNGTVAFHIYYTIENF